MGRVSLPDGVAPTNEKGAHKETVGFAVPDTATPEFTNPGNRPPRPRAAKTDPPRLKNGRFHRFEEDDEDDDDDKRRKKDPIQIVHGPHAPGPVILLVAIGLVLAALAAFVIVRNQPNELPLCSEQPDWNQYNCRAG